MMDAYDYLVIFYPDYSQKRTTKKLPALFWWVYKNRSDLAILNLYIAVLILK